MRNKEYLYYVYYDDKERKDVYCGLASDPKSREKAREIEIKELQSQKDKISIRIKKLRNS